MAAARALATLVAWGFAGLLAFLASGLAVFGTTVRGRSRGARAGGGEERGEQHARAFHRRNISRRLPSRAGRDMTHDRPSTRVPSRPGRPRTPMPEAQPAPTQHVKARGTHGLTVAYGPTENTRKGLK